MEPPETIDAGEVVLRRWEPAWAEQAAAAVRASLPELSQFMPWAVPGYDIEAARGYITATAAEWKEAQAFNYAVFTRAGELVGSGSLMARMGPGLLEIGYWTHSGHTGHGYASAAAAALARVGLTLPGIEQIVIRHDAANVASGRVAAKAGFTEVRRVEREPQAAGETGVDVLWEFGG